MVNTANATGDPPSGSPVVATASSVTIPEDPAPALTLVKTVAPAAVGAAGQTVHYTYVVTNRGNVTLKHPVLTETAFSGTGDAPTPSCPASTDTLLPGGELTCTADYTVTQADVDAGHVTNTAGAAATPPSGPDVASPPSTATVTVPGNGMLRVVKSASPSGVTSFTAGQAVTYSYVVTNAGNVTLERVAVQEATFTGRGPVPVPQCPASTLAPGAQVTCRATYTLTQGDIDAGAVTNVANATGHPPSGPPVVASDSSVTIPEAPAPALTVVKTADPARIGSAGDKVTYRFVVTNTGNVTMTDVTVNEVGFSGTGPAPVPACPAAAAAMLPGAQVTCTAAYTATALDAAAGQVTNTATASGTPPSAPPAASRPSSATVKVAGSTTGPVGVPPSVLPTTVTKPPPSGGLPRTGAYVRRMARFATMLSAFGLVLLTAGAGGVSRLRLRLRLRHRHRH
ncbi:MAG TPA: hypothetical protein VHL53_12570 [Acidimicrobiia bacterium]|nr:hypothetical protein [Acidimicrobiia bacterium]